MSTSPQKRRLWIVLGIVAVLVVVAGVGATLFATGVFGSPDGEQAKLTDEQSNVSPSIKELSSPSGEKDPPKYRIRDKACADVDWGPLEKLTGLDAGKMEETYDPVLGSAKVHCVTDNAKDNSSFSAEITIFDTVSAAIKECETLTIDSADEEAEGPWQQGKWSSGADETSAFATLFAQDSNAYINFSAGVDGGDSESDVKEAIVATTDDVLSAITVELSPE